MQRTVVFASDPRAIFGPIITVMLLTMTVWFMVLRAAYVAIS